MKEKNEGNKTANSTNHNQPKKALTGQESEPKTGKADAGRSSRSGVWIPLIAFVLLLIALLVAFNWLRTDYSAKTAGIESRLGERLDSVSESAQKTGSMISSDAKKVQQLTGTLEAQQRKQDALQKKQDALSQRISELSTVEPPDSEQWMLAEVEYLLVIGQQRLSLERDVKSALKALAAADKRLLEMSDPNLNSIREALIKEINELRALPEVDIAGMSLYLADLALRVDSLPLKDGYRPGALPAEKQKDSADEITGKNWRDVLKSVWIELKSLVVIKQQAVPEAVVFDPELRYFLYQTLNLELASARLSVLRRDTDNLQASLRSIENLLSGYFDTSDAMVLSIANHLKAMESVDLDPAMPSISRTLEALQDYETELRKLGPGDEVARQ